MGEIIIGLCVMGMLAVLGAAITEEDGIIVGVVGVFGVASLIGLFVVAHRIGEVVLGLGF